MSNVKKSVLTAVCIALCLVLPMAFHAIPNAGAVALPMHIPVLLCGLLCGGSYGFVCGAIGPLLSHLLTGMPLAGVLPFMMVECSVYGLMTGLMMKIRTKRLYADLYLSLTAAMLAGRVICGIVKALVFPVGEYSMALWVTSSFLTGLPGIAVQLVLIPTIVFALMKARLIPERYPKEI